MKVGRKERTAAGTAPRESHPRVVLTRPCSLPATLQTLGLRRQGSIIVLSARRRPQAATPALRHGKIAPLTPMRESLLAHLPPGSAQTECVRMPYDAPPLSCGHICQGTASGPPWVGETGKGLSCFSLRGPVRHFVVTIAWMSLISRRRFMASSRHT